MRILEKRANENGLPYYQMMENAGTGAAEAIMRETEAAKKGENQPVLVFCGKGNNGGDGFVIARVMHEKGYDVRVILTDGEPKTLDAERNLNLLIKNNIRIYDFVQDYDAVIEAADTCGIIVDALYGTGFSGKLRDNGLKAAVCMNRCRQRKDAPAVYAVDIPSGAGGDVIEENRIDANCVKADTTLTFHARKPLHMQWFADKYCGRTEVIDIGINEEKLWNIGI